MIELIVTWVLLSVAFLFGFLFRGWIARRDVAELDALRAQREHEVAVLNRMAR